MQREKRKIVAYCRVSTLEQKKGFGIDIQKRDIEAYAEASGLEVEEFYVDEARSGVEERRRGLRQLLRDSRNGKVGAIVIASLDRLSRDLRMTENLLYKLKKMGVKVLFADMPRYDGNDRRDVLIRQIREAIAEENRKEIIERLKKGREERVRKGKPPGGTVPYGYIRIEGTLRKNRRETGAVRLIFAHASQGKTGQAIAKLLNGRGHLRRNGMPWTQRQVCSILGRRELYQRGIIKYGDAKGRNKGLIIVGE